MLMLSLAGQAASAPADLIITGGPIYTMEAPQATVEAVAVQGNRIVWAGPLKGTDSLKGPNTQTLDLKGACMLPGLTDAHAHLLSLGKSLSQLNLTGTTSAQQIRALVLDRVAKAQPGTWISGRGWDQNDWADTRFPTWRDLAGSETNPVILRRIDGHAAWLNQTALNLCGITRDTPDPSGGRILRDPDGSPTGILVDNAADLAARRLPKPTPEEMAAWLEAALNECHRFGLTGVHDAGVDAATLRLYRQFRAQGRLSLRVYAMLSDEDSTFLADQLKRGREISDPFLVVRSVKLYADGALGSRGAALLEDYADDPGDSGLLVNQPDYLCRMSKESLKAGFQVCTHAIGDRGNRVTLDAYEKALSELPPGDYRLRIEHAQVVSPQDMPRFVRLSVIASMQPTHATSDMPWAQSRLGAERVRNAYAWRTLLSKGCRLALGSDFPIESPNPLLGIYAAVTRQDLTGNPPGGWQPQEKINIWEAVKGFTSGAAYAAFGEGTLGSIKVGKLADFTILNGDLFAVPETDIPALKTQMVIVNGKIVYTAQP